MERVHPFDIILVSMMLVGAACQGDGGSTTNQDAGPDTGTADTAHSVNEPSVSDARNGGDSTNSCTKSYPASSPSTFVAGWLPDRPQIDGEFEESIYGDLPAIEFTDSAGESDNQVSLRAGWTSERIYFAAEVVDDSIEHDPDEPFAANDGIELFFDTQNDDTSGLAADDHHWLLPVEKPRRTERGSDTEEEPETDIGLSIAVARQDGGYQMEVSAPLSDLELAPSAGDRVGFLVANNDRDEGSRRPFAWRGVLPFKQPDEWGDLLFARKSCRPTSDAGLDATTDDTSDTDPSDADSNDTGETDCPADADFEPLPVSGPETIGGGPGYGKKVCASDADTVATTKQELEDALASASSGDVVFLSPDAELDMGYDARLEVPSGVTLSGGRGCNCRAGALLFTDEIVKDNYDHEKILVARGGARVTGLRIRGPRNQRDWIPHDEQDHYLDGGGVDVEGSDVEVDNNEIWGFAHEGIGAGQATHVHHNFIHTMPRDGLGYGVSGGNDVLIEYNYFEFVRHAVASSGRLSYTARYNHMGQHAISHVFDMHKEGGETIEIHHNTVEAVDNGLKNKNVPAVTIRGAPSDTADIHHNWFYNPKEPLDQPVNSWTDEAIVQMHVTEWTNVEFWDNHYGSDSPPSCEYGAPRDGC